MPEGDTVHRAANRVRAALGGQELVSFAAPRTTRRGPPPGSVLEAVEARGKHLLAHVSDGTTVHVHLMMSGTWQVGAPGQRYRKPARDLVLQMTGERAEALCFAAPTVELLRTDRLHLHQALRALGPDLCLSDPDLDEVMRRAHELTVSGTHIADLLLDQRVSAGIGNVYRCEVLFRHGIHPSTPWDTIDPEVLRRLFADSGELLRANIDQTDRRTRRDGRSGSYVHGRGDRPCLICRTQIVVDRVGSTGRYRYHCPTCQPRRK